MLALGLRDRADPHGHARPSCSRCACSRRLRRRVARRAAADPARLPDRLRRPGARLRAFLPTDETVLGGIALALSYSAYVSEVFRAGIDSVHPSQPAAALALGLTRAADAAPRGRCRRRSAASCRRCSTTSSRCRRTSRWSRSSARRRSFARRADLRRLQTSTTRRSSPRPRSTWRHAAADPRSSTACRRAAAPQNALVLM